MQEEDVVKGQVYTQLDADRIPLGFWTGGIHRAEQIPEDALPISRELRREWAGSKTARAISADGKSLADEEERAAPLSEVKRRASIRAHSEADRELRRTLPQRTPSQARVWASTAGDAKASEASGVAPSAGEYRFLDAYLAGSTAATLSDAVDEILAAHDSEESELARVELVAQTALAAIRDATDDAAVRAVFPLDFGG